MHRGCLKNKVLRRTFEPRKVSVERSVHIGEFHKLQFTLHVREITSKRARWATHLLRVLEMRN
jgi:hypothetical protein